MRDLIDNLAHLAYPAPRAGEVTPAEAFDDAAEQIALERRDYAEHLRVLVDATDEDPLLAAVRDTAGRRDAAEDHLRKLIAYARHHTGSRPDYTWEALADAAGMAYSTVRRAISNDDVAAVTAILDTTVPAGTAAPAAPMAWQDAIRHGITTALADWGRQHGLRPLSLWTLTTDGVLRGHPSEADYEPTHARAIADDWATLLELAIDDDGAASGTALWHGTHQDWQIELWCVVDRSTFETTGGTPGGA